jgi:hypothetical protein
MAKMGKGMMERSGFGILMVIPGLLLIAGGVLVLIEPRVLVWFLAGASILMGLAILFFATFMRKIRARFMDVRG